MLLWITIGFCIVTVSHALVLLFVQKAPKTDHKKIWRGHLIMNGILWKALLISIVVMEWNLPQRIVLPQAVIGALFFATGFILFAWTQKQLGIERAMGKRFFFPEKEREWVAKGFYKFLNNPMYDGFFLIFLGLGLLLNQKENMILAGTSLLLLNGFLATIENKGKPWHLF